MLLENIFDSRWSIYINGRFQHDRVVFFHDGKVDGFGSEGFFSWLYSDGNLIIADELGKVNYKLSYISDAGIWISISQYRKTNNDILLSPVMSQNDMSNFFSDFISQNIANKSATYQSPDGEIWGNLFFGIDGKIYNYHNENESFWVVKNHQLYILDSNRNENLVSDSLSNINDINDFLFIPIKQISSGSIHYISFTENSNSKPLMQTKLDISLSNKEDSLVIIFNSAGEEYNGYNIHYEFSKLPIKNGVDFIRVAQSSPSRWYLDDLEIIQSIIASRKYKKVISIGMSMGGYASIWLTEKLSEMNTTTNYYTIAVQTLSSLNRDFLESFRNKFSDEYRSKTPDWQVIENYEKQNFELDLVKLVSTRKNNVEHHIIYDVLNESESYNAHRLKSDRVNILSIPYGVDHSEGCYKIYGEGMIDRLMKKILLGN